MIQRIQTLFLFFAALASGLLFFFPVAQFYGDQHILAFYVTHIQDFVPGNPELFSSLFILPLSILNAMLTVLPLLIIFMYKNLGGQLKLIRLNILLDLVLIGLLFFYYAERLKIITAVEADYDLGIFFPLIALIFLFLAMRGVRNDIKLIRSADRLR
ncbi:MAG: DUF4293 domain-containing protein [Bacteroidales bacterium]|jgi:hypothetical protein|nr:DUF4293 domain-containing protein [Bacteroidales bacterium]MDN5349100.1 hypothetical protein [Bacteroidales bacterium]